MKKNTVAVRSRNEKFTKKIKSEIFQEIACDDNPFLVKALNIRGYDVVQLMQHVSFTDSVFLLFKGELPSQRESQLFSALSVMLAMTGPRHCATRAATNAVIGKTANTHVLPVAAMALSGDYGGGVEVEQSMRFLLEAKQRSPLDVVNELRKKPLAKTSSDRMIAPGFGTEFGGCSPLLLSQKERLLSLVPPNGYLMWAQKMIELFPKQWGGWRQTGVIASVMCDLGFPARCGAAIFQLFSLPGAVAQAFDFSGRPLTDVPFLDDDHYIIVSPN